MRDRDYKATAQPLCAAISFKPMSAESNRLHRSPLAAVRVAEATTLALPEGLAFFRELRRRCVPDLFAREPAQAAIWREENGRPAWSQARRPARLIFDAQRSSIVSVM